MPLAELIRPQNLNEVVGQQHILGEGKPLRKIIEAGKITNLIFYGPPGTGKTTIAKMIARYCDKPYFKLNGTSASTADIKEIIKEAKKEENRSIILYLDEIQYLNKKQQQSILEYIESGEIILIASTTENPYFYVYNAILSRSIVFEFKNIEPREIIPVIKRGFKYLAGKENKNIDFEENALNIIANNCGGDIRKALNITELVYIMNCDSENILITENSAKAIAYNNGITSDRDGDYHFDLMSGLQKSIRGSDPDAAIFYLAKLLSTGDLISPCRRLLVIASEDVGMAYPSAISITKACTDSAMQLGLPEARIPLAQAVVLLATLPKSNSAYLAINEAMEDVKSGKGNKLPRCIQNAHYDSYGEETGQNYLYPHNYINDYVPQQYLPDDLKDKKYYKPSTNKYEQQTKAYWDKIKSTESKEK